MIALWVIRVFFGVQVRTMHGHVLLKWRCQVVEKSTMWWMWDEYDIGGPTSAIKKCTDKVKMKALFRLPGITCYCPERSHNYLVTMYTFQKFDYIAWIRIAMRYILMDLPKKSWVGQYANDLLHTYIRICGRTRVRKICYRFSRPLSWSIDMVIMNKRTRSTSLVDSP